MTKTLLSLIAIAAFSACDAAETNAPLIIKSDGNVSLAVPNPTAKLDVIGKAYVEIDGTKNPATGTWADVRGGVKVLRFTNSEPGNYQLVSGENRGDGAITNATFVPMTTRIRIFQMPVQSVQWFNDESNIWETVDIPLLREPRLVSETVRTNSIGGPK